MKELVAKVTKIGLRASQGQPTIFKKITKVRKSTIIMPADYGHVSKNFDPVFVLADSPDFVLVHSDLQF